MIYKKLKLKIRDCLYFIWIVILMSTVLSGSLLFCSINAIITICFICFARKIGSRKIFIKALSGKFLNHKKLLLAIFKHSKDLIFYKDAELKYVSFNQAFLKAHELNGKDELMGKNDFDFVNQPFAQEVRMNDEIVLKTFRTLKYNQRILTRSGVEHIYETVKTPIIENGKLLGVFGISRDITENYKLQQTLLEKQIEMEKILDNIPSSTYLKDIQGNILAWNKRFEEIFNCKEVKGKNFYDVLQPDLIEEAKKEDAEIIKTKNILIKRRLLNINNEHHWFEIYKTPIFDQNDNVSAIVALAKNIDSEIEIEAQKETFVATLTHDLKTPTIAQIKALELLLQKSFGKITGEQEEILQEILRSCNYMKTMISTILTTYKYDNGEIPLQPENFDIETLVKEICSETFFIYCDEEHEIKLHSELKNTIIFADKLSIKRVVINLISNAISYSNPRSVIDLFLNENEKNLTFKVKSYGDLINESELEALFEKYTSSNYKYNQVGTGLGLYLSKQIVKKHEGEMIAVSDVSGNTFGFSIPKVEMPVTSAV